MSGVAGTRSWWGPSMADTIALVANHYETLGLDPGATEDQIRQAFARQMAMFRPMAESARIGLAFETLRDAARRRAYDETLGLNRRPKVTAPATLSLHLSARFDPPVAEERASTSTAPSHDAAPSVAAAPRSAPTEESDEPSARQSPLNSRRFGNRLFISSLFTARSFPRCQSHSAARLSARQYNKKSESCIGRPASPIRRAC